MSMIICNECGKEFSDKATACPNCGCPVWDSTPIQQPYVKQNPPITNQSNTKQNLKKKNSTLSVWATICALFTCTSFIGFILGLIDLSKKDDTEKHTGSWFAIIFFVIMCVLSLITSKNNTENEDTGSTQIVTENNVKNNNENIAPQKTKEPIEIAETEEDYKNSCQEFNYKDVLRSPDDYVGKRICIEIKISNVFSEDWSTPIKYYFGYSKSDSDSEYYYGDRYAVFDYRYDNSLKLLQDDVIIVWGEISKPQETTSLIVNSEEVFCIDMKYAELISE